MRPGVYKHWKGKLYYVHGVAISRDREEQLVIYHALYGDPVMEYKPVEEFNTDMSGRGHPGPRYEFVRDL